MEKDTTKPKNYAFYRLMEKDNRDRALAKSRRKVFVGPPINREFESIAEFSKFIKVSSSYAATLIKTKGKLPDGTPISFVKNK